MRSRTTLPQRLSSGRLLARVLETPNLKAQIRALPGPVLGKLIESVGLDDAGELVALATTEQLAQVFDDDLWRGERAGVDERFDSGRFVLWLEIFLEAGEHAVAQRLAELPSDLLTLAIHRHVLVLSLDDLQNELAVEDEHGQSAEKAFASCLSEELDDYQLIWRGGEGWDSVLGSLLALDRDHHGTLVDLLERCAYLSRQHIDDEGSLYEVLSAEETLEGDLAAERETRRAERGHVAPSAAAAFLRLTLGAASRETPFSEHDPLTRAYLRALAPVVVAAPAAKARAARHAASLEQLLRQAWGSDRAEPPLLAARAESQAPLVIRALAELRAAEPELFAARSEELAYLANVLVAGATIEGRRLRPVEGVEHVLATVSCGLQLVLTDPRAGIEQAAAALTRYPADGLFRLALARASEPSRAPRPKKTDEVLAQVRALLKGLKV